MKIKHILMPIGLIFFSACQNTVEKKAPPSAYHHYLSQGYRDFALQENYEHHFKEDSVFTMKANLAAEGQKVSPHLVEQRKVPAETITALRAARNQLMTLSTSGVKKQYPYLLAQSQVMFDCWLEEQEENLNPYDIDICRNGFYKQLTTLQEKLKTQNQLKPRKVMLGKKEAKTKLLVKHKTRFFLYFPFDKTTLKADSDVRLKKMVAAYQALQPTWVYVAGHADLAGLSGYNLELSKRRVEETIKVLIKAGLPKKKIKSRRYGESKPYIKTKDGKRHAKNRRVVIWFDR